MKVWRLRVKELRDQVSHESHVSIDSVAVSTLSISKIIPECVRLLNLPYHCHTEPPSDKST